MNIFEIKTSVYFERIPTMEELKTYFPKYYKDNKNAKIKNKTGIIFVALLDGIYFIHWNLNFINI